MTGGASGPAPAAEAGGGAQGEVVALLSDPGVHPGGGPVRVIGTHGAIVLLAGEVALKIKRAVRYDYMDLSTPELRREMLARELALNRPAAPEIYEGLIPVTREADGRLALGGAGAPVEWVLRMRRFREEDELVAIAARGALDDALAAALGEAVFDYHRRAPLRAADGAALIAGIVDELDRVFSDMGGPLGPARIARFADGARGALAAQAGLLSRRGAEGHVRRGHGDLHLGNLVLLGGRPVPFDALEFDETLGTCDVLYDLAFLMMDLRHLGLARAANITLNAYLLAALGAEDEGLAALPLFLALRAAIRAMVLVQTDRARGGPPGAEAEARRYLDEAIAALDPPPPRLLAVGGFSGSGKTALAAALAPGLGAAPGAVHLRSDLERKARAGRPAAAPLPAAFYAEGARADIYAAMLGRARTILRAGHAVVLDATFLDPARRAEAEALAAETGVPFTGFWLEAPEAVLRARIEARRGDASDADAAVLSAQLARGAGPIGWRRLDAARPAEAVAEEAARLLGQAPPGPAAAGAAEAQGQAPAAGAAGAGEDRAGPPPA